LIFVVVLKCQRIISTGTFVGYFADVLKNGMAHGKELDQQLIVLKCSKPYAIVAFLWRNNFLSMLVNVL
jgi:hypothetical protein